MQSDPDPWEPAALAVVGTGYVGLTTGACLASPRPPRRLRRHRRRARSSVLRNGRDPDRRGTASRDRQRSRRGREIAFRSGRGRTRSPTPTSCSCACRRRRATTAVPTSPTSRTAAARDRTRAQARGDRGQQVDGAGRLDAASSSGCSQRDDVSRRVESRVPPRGHRGARLPAPRPCRHRRRRPRRGRAGRRRCTRRSTPTDHHHRPGLGRDDQVRRQRLPGDEDLASSTPSRRCARRSAPTSPTWSRASAPTSASAARSCNPGPGWGGSCFPKDSRALVKIAEDHGYDFSMMRGVIEVNDEQRERMVDKIARAVGRSMSPICHSTASRSACSG